MKDIVVKILRNRTRYLALWLGIQALSLQTFSTLASAGVSAEHDFLISTTDQWLMPRYATFTQQARQLALSADAACRDVTRFEPVTVQDAWRGAMRSWAAVGWVNYGPITEGNLKSRIQFWPDEKNLVKRKTRELLGASQPEREMSAEQLGQKSVAVQGLNALEYLLFDQEFLASIATKDSASRQVPFCRLLTAGSQNLAEIAADVEQRWKTSFREQWLDADYEEQQPHYLKDNLERVFGAMVASLEVIKSRKLAPAIGIKAGKGLGKTNPWLLESWRAEHSAQNMRATLESLQALYVAPASFSSYLLKKQPDAKALDGQIRDAFTAALAQTVPAQMSFERAVKAGEVVQMIELYNAVGDLAQLLKHEYAPAAGLKIGFNANDGD
ncbi:MAG: imelysin family protein [Hahellaceae bacterium]|nr:imelysin family protein [Hahellaceae bacterium]